MYMLSVIVDDIGRGAGKGQGTAMFTGAPDPKLNHIALYVCSPVPLDICELLALKAAVG